jgi:hypothetical protein
MLYLAPARTRRLQNPVFERKKGQNTLAASGPHLAGKYAILRRSRFIARDAIPTARVAGKIVREYTLSCNLFVCNGLHWKNRMVFHRELLKIMQMRPYRTAVIDPFALYRAIFSCRI